MKGLIDDLNQLAKYRISLILQGSSSYVGTHVRWLKFPSDPTDKEREINGFIDLVNRKFRGILQIIKAGDYIVPLIKNTKSEGYSNRILGKDAIALSFIILLHSFHNKQGPTLATLEEKLAGTKLEKKQINSLLNDLLKFRLIIKTNHNGIDTYQPTNALRGCVSHTSLIEIISKIYYKTKDEVLKKFMPPKAFLRTQQQVGNRIVKISDYFNKKSERSLEREEEIE